MRAARTVCLSTVARPATKKVVLVERAGRYCLDSRCEASTRTAAGEEADAGPFLSRRIRRAAYDLLVTAPRRDPSKHHYIPEFYLRWWTGEDGRFERYTQPVSGKVAVRRVYPSEAGFRRNLYESPGEPERARFWLETRLFQNIDNRAARALAKLNADPVPMLSVEEMSYWSIFIRSLHHRTPERLQAFRVSGQSEWLQALDEAREEYPRLKGEQDPETFEE